LNPAFSVAQTINDIDTRSVNWLLNQITIGEAQQNEELITDSLQKLIAIAPQRIETQCALARNYFANDANNKAKLILNKLDNGLNGAHLCVKQLRVIARSEGEDKKAIQKAKLLARAGQYTQARQLYNTLFKNTYPNITYELEHLSWYAQDSDQWPQVTKGYKHLLNKYPDVGNVEIAYARHLLRRNSSDKEAIEILGKYGSTSRFTSEVEAIWLNALLNMPIENNTDQQFQTYFMLYPFSSKGELQYQYFKKDLKAKQALLANPTYQLWVKGERLLEKDKLNAAEPLLLKALNGRPNDGAIMRSLGILYLAKGEQKKSYQYFTRAQKFTADFAEREVLKGLAKTAMFWLYIRQAKEAIKTSEFKVAQLKLDLADTLEEEANTVIYNRGLLLFAQGQYSQAAVNYQIVLKNDPLNLSALSGLLDIAALEQNEQALESFYRPLSAAQKRLIQPQYNTFLSNQLRTKATAFYDSGNLDEAEKTLKHAIERSPEESWLYYDLALIYQQKGLLKQARSLFNNVLWRFPLNSQLRYSHALFLRSIDDNQSALATLQYIPFKDRSEEVIALEQQLQLNESLTKSEQFLNSKDKATAIYHLSNLEAQPLTPLMQAELSGSWYQIDEKRHGLNLLNKALTAEPDLSPYWHMLYGQWLLEQNNEKIITQWFSRYVLPEPASESEKNQYVQLQNNYISQYYSGSDLIAKLNQLDQKYKNTPATTTALINANLALQQRDAAVILYQQKIQNNQIVETQALMAMSKTYRELGDDFQAKQIMQKAIAQTSSQERYVQRQIMTSLNDFNYSGDAIYLAEQLIEKSPNDQELRYLGAQVADKFNETEQAHNWYRQTLSPNQILTNEQIYSSLARINSQDPWYVNGAKRALVTQQNKNQAYIAIGVNFSGQTSTQSEATLGAGLVPLEAYFPLLQGQGFVKIDPTTISAQTTRFDEQFAGSRYGQGALCIFTCLEEVVSPQETGVDFGIGWQNENWRLDIGTTPLGFLIEDIVWGINYSDGFADFGYSLELEKRPVTSSVLSYAGLKDVNTDKVWGGVRSTGLTFNVSHDLGGDWGFWSSADFTHYKGQNVKDNNRYRIMGGSYYRVLSNQEREFTVGASLLHWAYNYNLSEETYGHGGYYSPQSYVGLSVPLTYDARWGNDFVYRLRTGVSFSATKTHSIDFFPNDPDLQAQAFVRQRETNVNPAFEGDNTSGISYNIAGSFEYRVTPHWFFGGYLAIDRSDFYEPNFGQLYVRYYFNPVYGTLKFPGTPIIPYAEF
jgi:tetratricopeptide (TPR) repeat protein